MILLHLTRATMETLLELLPSLIRQVRYRDEQQALYRVEKRITVDLYSSLPWIWLSLPVEDAGVLVDALRYSDVCDYSKRPGLEGFWKMMPQSIEPGPEDRTPFDPDTDLP